MGKTEKDNAIDYLVTKCEHMIEAVSPFLSWEMYSSTLEMPSETRLRIKVDCKNGYTKTVTLGDWRKMFIMVNHTGEEDES